MAHRPPPQELTIVAVAGVLRGYRDDARHELPGVLDGSSEALHQFRIAIRRARTVLDASEQVLHEDHRIEARRALRSMAALSSPVRDLDVFIGDLPGLAAELVDPGDGSLAALIELATAARQRPAVSLEWALRGPDGRHLFETWDQVATSVPPGGAAPGPLATEPAVTVVDGWTMQAFRRTRKKGRAALESDDLEHWHDLRKALKRLRYLVSAFDYLHRPKRLRAVQKQLKALQDHIGLLQDHRVQGELAADMQDRAKAAHLVGAADLAGDIGAGVGRRLARAHTECTDAWLAFDVPETKAAFEALTSNR